jgi:hypothetical protein
VPEPKTVWKGKKKRSESEERGSKKERKKTKNKGHKVKKEEVCLKAEEGGEVKGVPIRTQDLIV